MSPSVDPRRESGGPSPKPSLPPGLGVGNPFGAAPPGMFLGGPGVPFGAPFQTPFGLEAMYHPHAAYLERFGVPGVPGGPAQQGKAALDLLQQVSVSTS